MISYEIIFIRNMSYLIMGQDQLLAHVYPKYP